MELQKLSWILIGLSICSNGCVHAYRAYPDGCIPYDYCPSPPLPYTRSTGCPTPIANRWISESSGPVPSPVNDPQSQNGQ
jgi:hypothetical protein